MTLNEYIKKNGLVIKKFAKTLGVTEQSLHNWLNKKTPSIKNIKKIEAATGGLVKPLDWF
jgi:transcriptional regulator with XRE-family HTH domain